MSKDEEINRAITEYFTDSDGDYFGPTYLHYNISDDKLHIEGSLQLSDIQSILKLIEEIKFRW